MQKINDTSQNNYLYYKNEYNGFLYGNNSIYIKQKFNGMPMPKKIYLNELVLADLPSRQIVYTYVKKN